MAEETPAPVDVDTLRALLLPSEAALPAGFLPHGPGAFVPVRRELADALPALLDAAAERDRLAADLDVRTAERDAAHKDRARLLARVDDAERWNEAMAVGAAHGRRWLDEMRGERDRARDAAAALEAENAELRTALTAVAEGHETEVAEDVINGYCAGCEPAGYARQVLARTDPMRVDR